mmetsp:Transcript_54252/g.156835  ORF Transcript_54252/g.156835 Transcript_54252/m.156835 type:complete len:226 (+) Transcript_54252:114-791(+)
MLAHLQRRHIVSAQAVGVLVHVALHDGALRRQDHPVLPVGGVEVHPSLGELRRVMLQGLVRLYPTVASHPLADDARNGHRRDADASDRTRGGRALALALAARGSRHRVVELRHGGGHVRGQAAVPSVVAEAPRPFVFVLEAHGSPANGHDDLRHHGRVGLDGLHSLLRRVLLCLLLLAGNLACPSQAAPLAGQAWHGDRALKTDGRLHRVEVDIALDQGSPHQAH